MGLFIHKHPLLLEVIGWLLITARLAFALRYGFTGVLIDSRKLIVFPGLSFRESTLSSAGAWRKEDEDVDVFRDHVDIYGKLGGHPRANIKDDCET